MRSCRELKILEEDETVKALEMADDRNLSSHTYNEKLAQETFYRLPGHTQLLRKWWKRIQSRIN
ncbi:MAG TPA: nucleotidyltransferase substrate binding protein [Bacillales bacterium]